MSLLVDGGKIRALQLVAIARGLQLTIDTGLRGGCARAARRVVFAAGRRPAWRLPALRQQVLELLEQSGGKVER